MTYVFSRRLMPLVASVLMLSLLALQGTQVWAASAGRVVVSTNHLAVAITFPVSAHPGQRFIVGAEITAHSNARIISLSIEILAYVNGRPVTLASQTIMADRSIQTGASWQTSLTVVIPAEAQPGPLTGRLTEVWQATPSFHPNYYSSNYYSNCYPSAYSNYYTSTYYSNYYPYSYEYVRSSRYSSPYCRFQDNQCYTNAYYNHRSYYTSPNYGYATGNVAFWTPTDTQYYVYGPAYVCEPAPYYGLNSGPSYAPNYASQVSQRTFTLTYIVG